MAVITLKTMELFFLFSIIILLYSIILHEISHGAVADYLGDPTAKMAGRLSLNPLKHLDFIGSIILPLTLIILKSPVLFGWAKPVPVNPFYLRDKKYGQAKVALAGPLANLSIAIFFGLLIRFFGKYLLIFNLLSLISYIVLINLALAVFNLLPIPPLDGSHLLFAFLKEKEEIKIFFLKYGLLLLLFFIFFLSPILSLVIKILFKLIVGLTPF